MRRLLFSFLILVMLVPSMACAMPSCAGMMPSSTERHMSHMQHMSHEHSGKPMGKVKLLGDCMGNDLQAVDMVHLDPLKMVKKMEMVPAEAGHVLRHILLESASDIRGSPPDWQRVSVRQPSLILTTQRIRL